MTVSYYSIRFLTGQLIDLAVEQHIELMTPPLLHKNQSLKLAETEGAKKKYF